MRQSEARDLRSFLEEPVEELVVEDEEARSIDLQRDIFTLQDTGAPLQEAGVKFISGTDMHLPGTGVQFTTPWEGTGGQLHEVGARFTGQLMEMYPQDASSSQANQRITDDFTLQQTMPIARIPNMHNVALKPHRLQRYQSRGVPVSLSRSASGTLRLRPAGTNEPRATADLAPAPHKIVPGEPSPALQSWERRRHAFYTWLVLLSLFLLVVLGGIGLDSLIASYR